MADEVPTRSPRGRWLRYSLRTLLVLVTLFAVTVALRASRIAQQRRAVTALTTAGALVVYFDEGWGPIRGYGRVPLEDTATCWARAFFGLRRPGEVYLKGSEITDELLRDRVLPLRTLGAIGLTETAVTPTGLARLAPLVDLRIIAVHSDARHDAITGTLSETTMIEFQQTPLQDAVDYLVDLHQIPIEIDKASVPAPQWDSRSHLTATIKGKPLCEALNELLAPSGLGWIVSGGSVVITTRAVQDEHDGMIQKVRATLPQVKELVID
ncbi:MAG: hypothetical protein WD845_06715 [Pirellulales bacterium]